MIENVRVISFAIILSPTQFKAGILRKIPKNNWGRGFFFNFLIVTLTYPAFSTAETLVSFNLGNT